MSSFQLKAQVCRYVHTYVRYSWDNGQTSSTDYRKMPLYLCVGEKGGREGGREVGAWMRYFFMKAQGFSRSVLLT